MESLNLLCVDMNALELADELENTYPFVGVMEVAAIMLRQQEVEIERITSKHEEMLRQQQAEIEALKEPKIPLLDQEIKFILGNGQCWQGEDCSMPNLMYIIRAVEAAHGIGVKQNEQ